MISSFRRTIHSSEIDCTDGFDDELMSIGQRYARLLEDHFTAPREWQLLEAADLGHELLEADVPTEEIIEIHEIALRQLGRRHGKYVNATRPAGPRRPCSPRPTSPAPRSDPHRPV